MSHSELGHLLMCCAVDVTCHVALPCHVLCRLPCQQPCHRTRQFTYHRCHPCHRHVNSHVILHVINVWYGNWIRDENYTVCDVYFGHRKWVWVGLWGPGDILWQFQNVMDQVIRDENLRNVTRCDLWRSIHDAIWDHHKYCFMTIF